LFLKKELIIVCFLSTLILIAILYCLYPKYEFMHVQQTLVIRCNKIFGNCQGLIVEIK
jgi:hypothetical protein